MGIFSSIVNVVKKAIDYLPTPLSKTSMAIAQLPPASSKASPTNPLNIISASYVQPISFISNPLKSVSNVYSSAGSGNALKAVGNTAIVGSTIATGGYGALGQIGVKTGTATLLGGLFGGGGASFLGGVLTSSPKAEAVFNKAVSKIPQIPGALETQQKNIGSYIEDPSVSNLKKIATDTPFLAGAEATFLGYVGLRSGSKLLSTGATYLNTRAENRNTEIAKDILEQAKKDAKKEKPVYGDGLPYGGFGAGSGSGGGGAVINQYFANPPTTEPVIAPKTEETKAIAVAGETKAKPKKKTTKKKTTKKKKKKKATKKRKR